MTRRLSQLTSASARDKSALLMPLPQPRNRTTEVIDRLAREIRAGSLKPGDKLPTEQALMAALGVSRTVVREAVAALKAEGLVTTRQGSGAFVAAEAGRLTFHIDSRQLSAVEDAVSVMELRLAVEIEAAGLAAERAPASAVAAIRQAHAAFLEAVGRDELAASEDFEFHRAIAHATGNERFADFLSFLGQRVVPRLTLRGTLPPGRPRQHYLTRIAGEHARITEAIAAGQPTEARRSMRTHLSMGLLRYRRLAEAGGKAPR
jgi:DNA-binding FadR family transcriptional regulator